MTYSNKKGLMKIMGEENLFAKKELSQNFLFNIEVIKKIIATAEINPKEHIVEVGPGLGFLTQELIKSAKSVHAIELDRQIIPYVKKHFAEIKNFTLEEGNVLKAILPSVAYKLVANIPYHITSPLISHFLQPKTADQKRPDLIVLLVQKEVAEKICAETGNHTILSLSIQVFGTPKLVATVSKNDFFPSPRVDSAILKIVPYPTPLIKDFPAFKQLINSAFSQKRKTISNSLKIGKLKKQETENLLLTTGIDPMSRPQNLSIEDWSRLMEKVSSIKT